MSKEPREQRDVSLSTYTSSLWFSISTQDNVGAEWFFAQQRQSQDIEPEQPLDRDFLGLLQRRDGRLQGCQGGQGQHEAGLHGDRV